MSTAPTLRVTCETGPAAGRATVLGVGRHIVGRSPTAAVRIADPAVEAHQAVLELRPDGSVAFTQVTGRVPCRREGDLVWLGASRLRLGERPPTCDLAATIAAVEAGEAWRAGPLQACLGWGRPAELTSAALTDEPVEITPTPGWSITLAGSPAAAVARAVIVQLAARCGPDTWELVVLDGERAAWSWCAPLPHRLDLHEADLDAHLADGSSRTTVVVTQRARAFAEPASPLRRAVARGRAAALVVDTTATAPVATADLLELGSVGHARWRRGAPGDSVRLQPAGLDVATAAHCATALADQPAAGRLLPPPPLPSRVTLAEVFEQHGPAPIDDAVALAGRWQRRSEPTPVVLGLTAAGIAALDWAEIIGVPVGIVGAPGSGRTDLLRALVVNLACRFPPGALAVTLVGGDLGGCDRLPHVVGPGRAVGCPLLVVVDEPEAGLRADDLDAALASLTSPRAQLVVAAPRSTPLVDAALAHERAVRIALRLDDDATAVMAVGDTRPTRASPERPGRAVLRAGRRDPVVMQATWTGDRHGDEHGSGDEQGRGDDGDVLISTIRHAATLLPARANMPG